MHSDMMFIEKNIIIGITRDVSANMAFLHRTYRTTHNKQCKLTKRIEEEHQDFFENIIGVNKNKTKSKNRAVVLF